MDVSTAVAQRISTRAFKPDPLSEADIRDWLTAAQRAPSGGNTQPWRVIVVTGAAKDEVIGKAAGVLKDSPAGQPTDRPIYPKDLWEPHEARRRRVGEMIANNFRFFGAPVAVFIVIDERMGHGQWGHTGMYLQTLALLAEERGWGTCMQECWGILRPMLKKHFGLGESEMVWCGMAVGIPDADHPVNSLRAERADIDEIAVLKGF